MKVTKKNIIGIIISFFCMVSVSMADCPSGTYPCTLGNGLTGCCPKKSDDGVRGSLDGQTFFDSSVLFVADSGQTGETETDDDEAVNDGPREKIYPGQHSEYE